MKKLFRRAFENHTLLARFCKPCPAPQGQRILLFQSKTQLVTERRDVADLNYRK
jgi:hypothetical protein